MMITLDDLNKYYELHDQIVKFMIKRCKDVSEVKIKYGNTEWWLKQTIEDEFKKWYYEFDKMCVSFYSWHYDEHYEYYLPLNILFEEDFKILYEESVKEELEKQRLERIEREKKYELRKKEEEEKQIEVDKAKLIELMERFPEIVEDTRCGNNVEKN